MKSFAIAVPVFFLAFSAASAVETHMHEHPSPTADQKPFTVLKGLAGTWEGIVHVEPPAPQIEGKVNEITMRVTSRGNALVHEMKEAGTPDDPTRFDHPVTLIYVEDDQLVLTHYCDAGNRPRMKGDIAPDGKTVDFALTGVSGSQKYGHMDHATFTLVDADHHIEDWTYMLPGNKAMHAHFELHRTK
jgi:hypothetical protein